MVHDCNPLVRCDITWADHHSHPGDARSPCCHRAPATGGGVLRGRTVPDQVTGGLDAARIPAESDGIRDDGSHGDRAIRTGHGGTNHTCLQGHVGRIGDDAPNRRQTTPDVDKCSSTQDSSPDISSPETGRPRILLRDINTKTRALVRVSVGADGAV